MNYLVFDCVLNKTFITLVKNGEFIDKIIESDSENYHSVYLISEIKNILDYYKVIPASGWVLIDFYYTGTNFENEVETALKSAGYYGKYMPRYDASNKIAKLLLEY